MLTIRQAATTGLALLALTVTINTSASTVDKPEPASKQLVNGFKGKSKIFSVFVTKPFRMSTLSISLRDAWEGARPKVSISPAKALKTGVPIVVKFLYHSKGQPVLKRFKVHVKRYVPIAERKTEQ